MLRSICRHRHQRLLYQYSTSTVRHVWATLHTAQCAPFSTRARTVGVVAHTEDNGSTTVQLAPGTLNGNADSDADTIIPVNELSDARSHSRLTSSAVVALKYLLRSKSLTGYVLEQFPNITKHHYRTHIKSFASKYASDSNVLTWASTIDGDTVSNTNNDDVSDSGSAMDESESVRAIAWCFAEHVKSELNDERMVMKNRISKGEMKKWKSRLTQRPVAGPAAVSVEAVRASRSPSQSQSLADDLEDVQHDTSGAASYGHTDDVIEEEDADSDYDTNYVDNSVADACDPSHRLTRDQTNRLLHDPSLSLLADLSEPHEWFPLARSLNRKIHLHVGSTNSGKTYTAMQSLKAAKSGIYCGPLRLLSWECYDKLTSDSIITNLVTGQEKIEHADATHISCTIEMISEDNVVDVGVIDECQLLGSDDRGQHWTRALLGLPAKELHLCGDTSVIDIVTELCAITGESLTVHHYKRLTPLKLSKPLASSFASLRRGDAVIGFSRASLYQLKYEIERTTALKCCIVYGSLPPKLRRQQATLFNDPNSGYDVLVASDAIGMGLNLRIGRVILSTLQKFDGHSHRLLDTRELLQIAGRAGRFNSEFDVGYVTTLHRDDYSTLKNIISEPLQSLTHAGLSPSVKHIQQFSLVKPDESIKELVAYLSLYSKLDDLYFLSSLKAMKEIATLIERYCDTASLTLTEKFLLCLCPIDTDRDTLRQAFLSFVNQYIDSRTMRIGHLSSLKTLRVLLRRNNYYESIIVNDSGTGSGSRMSMIGLEVSELEEVWHQLDLYAWMTRKFGEEVCVEHSQATQLKEQVSEIIAAMLESSSYNAKGQKRVRKIERRKERRIQAAVLSD